MVKFIATLARARIHIDARELLIFMVIGVVLPNSISVFTVRRSIWIALCHVCC